MQDNRDPASEPVLIWSGEHSAYWRAGSSGYTIRLTAAGIYTRAQAEQIAAGCDPSKQITIEPIAEFMARAQEMIDGTAE